MVVISVFGNLDRVIGVVISHVHSYICDLFNITLCCRFPGRPGARGFRPLPWGDAGGAGRGQGGP